MYDDLFDAVMDCKRPRADRLLTRSTSSMEKEEVRDGGEEENEESVEVEEEKEDISSLTPFAMAAVEASRLSRSRDKASRESASAWQTN